MRRLAVRAVAFVLVIVAAACHSGGSSTSPSGPSGSPTSPSGRPGDGPTSPPRPPGEAFEVTGVVTDDAGRPVQGIAVRMRYWLGGHIEAPAALTDAAGAYRIAFSSNPWNAGSRGRGAARAELIVDGYEWYYRTVIATAPQLVENFRLNPLRRIAAGESVALSMTQDDGECVAGLSWTLATVCRTVSVRTPAPGSLTVQAIGVGDAGQPLVSVCCVSGDDRGGNPVTLPVSAGNESTVEVGLLGSVMTAQPIVVKTSFDP